MTLGRGVNKMSDDLIPGGSASWIVTRKTKAEWRKIMNTPAPKDKIMNGDDDDEEE